MEWVHKNFLMEMFFMDFIYKVNQMDQVNICGLMGLIIKETLKMD